MQEDSRKSLTKQHSPPELASLGNLEISLRMSVFHKEVVFTLFPYFQKRAFLSKAFCGENQNVETKSTNEEAVVHRSNDLTKQNELNQR